MHRSSFIPLGNWIFCIRHYLCLKGCHNYKCQHKVVSMFMPKKITVLKKEATTVITVLLVFGFTFIPDTTEAGEFPVRAPAALPGTTEEMSSPDFWIDRIHEPDRKIKTAAQKKALVLPCLALSCQAPPCPAPPGPVHILFQKKAAGRLQGCSCN